MSIQWPLLVFSLLAGSGGALLAFTGVAEATGVAKKTRNAAVACALVLLVVGGCASVVHLAQPANIMAAAANVFSFSGISVELIRLCTGAAASASVRSWPWRARSSPARRLLRGGPSSRRRSSAVSRCVRPCGLLARDSSTCSPLRQEGPCSAYSGERAFSMRRY